MVTVERKFHWQMVWPYLLLGLLSGLYIILTYLTQPDPNASDESLFLRLTVVIPELVVWFLALLGTLRFTAYANSIKKRQDGKGLVYISRALLLMVLYVILLTTANTVVRLFEGSDYLMFVVFLGNHLPLATVLASAVMLFIGTQKLTQVTRVKLWSSGRLLLVILASIVFFVWFARDFYNANPSLATINGIPKFALSDNVLIFSYVLPHAAAWLLGLLACLNLASYVQKVPGKVYRSLFQNLYRGLLLVYACTFVAQFIIISSISLNGSSPLLALSYVVLAVGIFGFWLIYRGTTSLTRLEIV